MRITQHFRPPHEAGRRSRPSGPVQSRAVRRPVPTSRTPTAGGR